MIALLLGNWRLVGLTLAALTVVAAAYGWLHQHDKGVRAPMEAEIRLLNDEKKANEKRAADMLAARIAENKQLKEQYDADAKQKDTDYAKLLARFNSRGPVGVREYRPGEGCAAGGQAAENSTGTSATPAAKSEPANDIRELVLTEAAVGQVLQWYAYGQSCYAFVNGK